MLPILQLQHQEVLEKRQSTLEHSKVSIKHTIKALEHSVMLCDGESRSRINNQIADFYRQLKQL